MGLLRLIRHALKKLVRWQWAIIVSLILLSVILFFIGHFKLIETPWVVALSNGIWKSILSGGFFALILKSFQFLNLFRQELQEIIFGSEYLKYTTVSFKEKAWKNITKSLYKSSFPQISNNIENIVYEKFLPVKLDYYHKDWEVYYEIRNFDKNHIILVEHQKFTIVTDGEKTEMTSFDSLWGKNSTNDKSELIVTKLLINGADCLQKINPPLLTKEGGYKKIVSEFTLALNSSKEYHVEKILKTVHNKQLNVFWRRDIQRYTDSFQIGIKENSGMEIDLITFGQVSNFKSIGEPVVKDLKKHQGLLLPGEGYIIFVK